MRFSQYCAGKAKTYRLFDAECGHILVLKPIPPSKIRPHFRSVFKAFKRYNYRYFLSAFGVIMSMEEEQQVQQQPAAEELGEEGVDEAEEAKLPFPNARIVSIIRENLKQPHQLKKEVKLSANYLLAEILKDISISMDSEPYNSLSMDHFNKASRKYREIALSQARIRRIQKVLEKQRAELDEIITEIELESPAGGQD